MYSSTSVPLGRARGKVMAPRVLRKIVEEIKRLGGARVEQDIAEGALADALEEVCVARSSERARVKNTK